MLEELKKKVYYANMRLRDEGLVVLTWGNASAFDPETGLVAIKPSGVSYGMLKPRDIVVVDLDGKVVEGRYRPSSDTPTHLEFYRSFKGVFGAVHTHSAEAVAWAQAAREIPCYGTTHADCFHGPVPVTRYLSEAEVAGDYEGNTGKVIVKLFRDKDPLAQPGVLVAGHGPFTWGKDVMKAVDNAVSLEEIAKMARNTESLAVSRSAKELPAYIGEKHYSRKHGPNAYYGQGGK
ncbi:MAG: L-ribulose-5-phosphate 4-epimerase AraD [Kiritimatiellae bacterium]|nr:L-ribulose-5-phosphate 4-epimerase AraD [Kiritimatiellia bacterium]